MAHFQQESIHELLGQTIKGIVLFIGHAFFSIMCHDTENDSH